MFLRIHLNPSVPKGQTNMLLLRDLLLDYHEKDEILVDQSLKKVFVKHFTSWMNPVNLALNNYSKNPAYQAKHLEDPHQNRSDERSIFNSLHGREYLSNHTLPLAAKLPTSFGTKQKFLEFGRSS